MERKQLDDGGVVYDEKQEIKEPPKYVVLIHNDNYTPIDFVMFVLQKLFRKTIDEATDIAGKAHKDGHCPVAVYSFEIAETKVAQVLATAKEKQYPLLCTLEPE